MTNPRDGIGEMQADDPCDAAATTLEFLLQPDLGTLREREKRSLARRLLPVAELSAGGAGEDREDRVVTFDVP